MISQKNVKGIINMLFNNNFNHCSFAYYNFNGVIKDAPHLSFHILSNLKEYKNFLKFLFAYLNIEELCYNTEIIIDNDVMKVIVSYANTHDFAADDFNRYYAYKSNKKDLVNFVLKIDNE